MNGLARQILVVRGGLLTTVQDLGRHGLQNRGVPPAGPMDASSHRLANLLVGNSADADAAALEVTMLGPELLFECDARIAICGAEFAVTAAGRAVPLHAAVDVPAHTTVRFGTRTRGARAYLAVNGGLDMRLVLGSRATHVVSHMGGHEGRRLQDGDKLGVGRPSGKRPIAGRPPAFEMPDGGTPLRVLMGPHAAQFTDAAVQGFLQATYTVTNESDRMAYRLNGPAIASGGAELISDVLPTGGIQVPGSGQPILLMADRATTGGYPMIATVITADLPLAGQLAPGDWVRFVPCTPAAAMAALIARERRLIE